MIPDCKISGQSEKLSCMFFIFYMKDSPKNLLLLKMNFNNRDPITFKEIQICRPLTLKDFKGFKILSDNKTQNQIYLHSSSLSALVTLNWSNAGNDSLDNVNMSQLENSEDKRILFAQFSRDGKYYFEVRSEASLRVVDDEGRSTFYGQVRALNEDLAMMETRDKHANRILLL